jgi:hypothetical protein
VLRHGRTSASVHFVHTVRVRRSSPTLDLTLHVVAGTLIAINTSFSRNVAPVRGIPVHKAIAMMRREMVGHLSCVSTWPARRSNYLASAVHACAPSTRHSCTQQTPAWQRSRSYHVPRSLAPSFIGLNGHVSVVATHRPPPSQRLEPSTTMPVNGSIGLKW